MKRATNIGREELMSLGTCFGKMTKSGKFRLGITCLDYLAQYAKVLSMIIIFLISTNYPFISSKYGLNLPLKCHIYTEIMS